MVLKNVCGGHALRIAVGITVLVLLLVGGAGAKYINATGGDCISFGTWNAATMTCTMTTDLTESIQIDSNGVTLNGNGHTITGNGGGGTAGVSLSGRSGVTIKNINTKNYAVGIFLVSSNNNILSGNNATSNGNSGITMTSSSNNMLSNNNANSNNGYGIYMGNSNNNILSSNSFSNDHIGIYMSGSKYNTLNSNDASNNIAKGYSSIYLTSSSNSTLSGNNASNNSGGGIYLSQSSNSTLSGNNASNNDFGITLSTSSDSMLSGNTANSNKLRGISVSYESNYNMLNGNTANSNTETGIYMYGADNNTLSNNNANSNTGNGIYVWASRNNTLSGNNANSNKNNGIMLWLSSYNTLNDNNANSNNLFYGISLSGSNNNMLSSNNASKNNYGIYLSNSQNNTVSGNNANSNNNYGIYLYSNPVYSYNNIYNNYFNNTINYVINTLYTNINTWNTTKTSGMNIIGGPYLGGNFWAHPNGTGFSQTCTDADSDGICDSQYKLDNNNIDYLPLSMDFTLDTTPVLLVHGWGGSSTDSWNKNMFTERGFDVETFDYDSRQDIKKSALELKNKIKTITDNCKSKGYGCPKIDIVSHSEGGLVAREYINSDLYRNDVRKLIMIGTPNHGLDIKRYGDIAGKLAGGYWDLIIPMLTDIYVGVAGFQMEPHSPFLKSLNGNDNCVESQPATDHLNPSIQYYTLIAHPPLPTISHNHYKVSGKDFTTPWFTFDGDIVVADNSLKLTGVQFEGKVNAGWHMGEGTNHVIIDQAISYLLEDTPNMNQLQQRQFAASNIQESSSYLSAQWSAPINGKINSGEIKTHTVFIDNTTKKANFNLFWENADLDLVLYSPDGMEINSSSALSYPDINYTKETLFEFYEIQNPQSGNWTMEITPVNVSGMGENYSVITFMETDLFVGVGTNKDLYNPDEPMTVFAYLQDSGLALPGANVTAKISGPDGTNSTVQLYDDGLHNDNQTNDGIYSSIYTITNVSGVYDITVLANGMKENNPFERTTSKTVWIEQYPDLTIYSPDINFSKEMPSIGENITINAKIHNIGDANAINASILFYDGDPVNDKLIGEDIINVDAGQIAQASVSWKIIVGKHEIYVLINPFNIFFEKDYTNNKANKIINVTIDNTPKIFTITSPNGEDKWTRGTTKTIKWTSTENPGSYVKIELIKSGVPNKLIISSTLNDGSHPWFIPATLVPGNDYQVKITNTINASKNGTSDNFTIPTPSINVISPNRGENWTRGTTRIINWSSTESPGTYVKIELLKPGKPNQLIISATLNDGSHPWLIPAAQAPGTDYKVKITSTINASNNDTSDSNFTVPAPNITVITPNAGETWRRGTTQTIRWNSSGSPGTYVKIELLKGGVLNKVIIVGTLNDGIHPWLIPATQVPGNDYKVRITSTTNSTYNDTSDSNFTIPIPSINVVTPNGGENWTRGTTKIINWSSTESPGTYVKIELLKPGKPNQLIISATLNDGSHPWLIPPAQASGSDYKVRTTSTANVSNNDTSDNNFTIPAPSITVVSPNGGENWTRGTYKIINWSSTESPGSYIKIELLKAGVLNRVIVASTINDGSHPWLIPVTQITGSDYRVKITSTANISNTDTGNNDFTIVS